MNACAAVQYQLVDLWAADRHVSYAKFLNWTFENISEWKADWRPRWAEAVVGDRA